MTTKRIAAAVLVAALIAPAPARAETINKVGGWMVVGGIVMVITAFDYHTDVCPPGYSTHTFQNGATQCVLIYRGGSDVREASTEVTYKRPTELKVGLAAIAGGLLLATLPKPAQKVAPSVSVTPHGWRVSKTITR